MSWAVLLLMSFCRGWIEGICGVNVFKLVFLLFEEESLKMLTLDLHILYRSLYNSSGMEGRCFGRVVFTGLENEEGVLKKTLYSLYTDNTILL